MADRTIDDQLTKYLTDVHSIEVQALAQLETAPDIAGDERLAAAFREHLEETREHERLVREQLEARGGTSTLKDLAGRVGGWAMIVFARLNPDTPGKLTAHAFSYEHMELAAYEPSPAPRSVPTTTRWSTWLSASRLRSGRWPSASRRASIRPSRRPRGTRTPTTSVRSWSPTWPTLTPSRPRRSRSSRRDRRIAGFEALAQIFREHLEETREQQRLVEERLSAHGAAPSRLKSTGMRIGGLNVAAFFAAQPDTPAKLAGFAFAFEHLEIAAYELLRRIADRADDPETVAVAERILVEERRAAERIAETWTPPWTRLSSGSSPGPPPEHG